MKLDVTESVDSERWDRAIRAFSGCIFHSHAWSEFRCAASDAQRLFFRWTDKENSELVGLAVGTQRPPPTSRLGRFGSYVLIESPPATLHRGIDFIGPLRSWALDERRSVAELRLGSFDPRSRWADADPPASEHRYEFLFPRRDEADVLRAMRKGTRSAVKRGERLGVSVRVGESVEDLASFVSLQDETAHRLAQTKGVRPTDESRAARLAALETLVRNSAARLYLASLDAKPIAGCFFGIWDRSAYYLQNGAGEPARTTGAVHVILHHAICDFMREDFRRVNLGGVSAASLEEGSSDHGLYSFKLGLGTEMVPCTSGSLIVRQHRARAIAIARQQRLVARTLRRRIFHG